MHTVTFPWPPSQLSPNSNPHWSVVAKAKKKYREVCWKLALEAGLNASTMKGFDEALIHMAFYQPSRHHRDKDNMLASMKSALDGLADALQVNDHCFVPTAEWPTEIAGMVVVSITPRMAKATKSKP